MLSSSNTIADLETLYARLGERDYEAVMSYLADDIVWIVADNSPLADRSPYHGIAEVRSGVFERLTAGFDKLVFDADEIFECNGGERVVALGYYYFRFHGQAEERKAQVAHVWTIRDGRAIKFQQYLDTFQVARDAGAAKGSRLSYLSGTRNNYLFAALTRQQKCDETHVDDHRCKQCSQ